MTRSSLLDGRWFWHRLLHAGLENRLSLLGLDSAGLDLLGPVTGDDMAVRELAQRRDLGRAAGRLDVGAARMESTGARRVRRAREIAGQQDRLALRLDLRIRDRHRREERDRVRMQ